MIGGRGAGKTRTGAEWVRALALGDPAFTRDPVGRIALVGETFADLRDVMVDGPSGLLALPGRRPAWSPSRRRLEWDNGAVALAFSAEEPDSLRGPQFGAVWSDEVAKWRYAEAAYDMIQFGLRLGHRPRGLVTTTPRPIPLLRRILADPRTVVSRAPHRRQRGQSRAGLPRRGGGALRGHPPRAPGTRRRADRGPGRRPLGPGRPGGGARGRGPDGPCAASWWRSIRRPPRAPGRMPAGSWRPASMRPGTPSCSPMRPWPGPPRRPGRRRPWRSTIACRRTASWSRFNQGGEMATTVLRQVDAAVPVTPVRAARGKYLRAEAGLGALRAGARPPCRRPAGPGGRTLRFRPRTASRPAPRPTASTPWSGP